MHVFELLETGRHPVAELDLRSDSPEIRVSSVRRNDRGQPPEQYFRHVQVFPLPAVVDIDALERRLAAGHYNALIDRIKAGYESIWDGSTRVASFSEDAERAIGALASELLDSAEVDVITNVPEGFRATILLDVSDCALDAYLNGLSSPEESAAITDALGAEYADRLQELYPDHSVEYEVRSLRDGSDYRVAVSVSCGGYEVASRWQQAVERTLEEIDHDAVAEVAVAAERT